MKPFFFTLFFLIIWIAVFPQANQNTAVNNKIIPPENTYAVIIGIARYEDDNIPVLNFSNKDAEVFAGYLQSKAGGGVSADNIRLLLDSKATTAAIYNALKWLKERCVLDKDENNNSGNLIYFYFSGHGDMEVETLKELGFLLSFNTPSNNYINNAVRLEDLNYYANTLSVNFNAQVVIITDACHSGKLAGSDNHGSYLVGKELSTVRANEVRITSCAPEEVSNENEKWGGGRGVFSYYLVNGLKGDADKNHDSTVTLNEIKEYIDRKISTDPVIKEYNLKQTPVLKGSDNFRLSVVDTAELLSLQKSLEDSEPVQSDQEYFFSLLKERDKLESIDFVKLNKLPPEKIPASFIREVLSISDTGINIKRIEQLVNSILKDKEELKLFKENLVEALHTSGQKIINLYLSGDAAELERRRYYNSKSSGYDIYPKMYSVALKLTEPDNPFYQILKVNQYYFSGVAARLKMPTVEESKQKLLLEEALTAQKMALTLEKNAAYIHNELGILYKAKKDFTVAEDYFKNATILAPGWAIPHSNLSGLYGETKKYEDALKSGEKAESLQPGLHITNSNTGVAYELAGNLLFAEEFYHNAIDINSRHYFPFERLGYVYLNTTQYAQADSFFYEADLRKKGYHFKENESDIGINEIVAAPMSQFFCYIDTLILQKDDILAFFTWGVQDYQAKNYKNAERIFKKVIALDKTNPLVFHYMGKIFYDQQKWEEAEVMFKFAVSYYLGDSAFNKYCDSVINSKKYPYDHECFENFFKNSYYQMTEDYYFLGTLYESWAHYEEADIWYRKIIELEKDNLGGYVKLWRMLEKLGRYTETEKVIQSYAGYDKERTERELNEFYRRTILKFPENGDWPYRLGLLLYDRAETKSRTAYLDTIIWFPKLNREIFIDMDSYERLSTDLKWDKTISGSPQLVIVEPQLRENPAGIRIQGTGELITLADAIYTPRKDAITYLLIADSLLTETETKADINFKVGNVFVWASSKKQAYPYYVNSVKLAPGNANARLSLIDVCKALYKNRAGLEQLDYLYEHQQINFPKRLMLAEFSIHSGQFEKAKKLIVEAQAIHPYMVPEAFDLLGRMNLLAHQPKLALPFYNRYLELNNKNYLTIYTIARLYAQAGNKKEALMWLSTAIKKGFNYLYVINADASWRELKKTPAWKSLIAKMKAKKYINHSVF